VRGSDRRRTATHVVWVIDPYPDRGLDVVSRDDHHGIVHETKADEGHGAAQRHQLQRLAGGRQLWVRVCSVRGRTGKSIGEAGHLLPDAVRPNSNLLVAWCARAPVDVAIAHGRHRGHLRVLALDGHQGDRAHRMTPKPGKHHRSLEVPRRRKETPVNCTSLRIGLRCIQVTGLNPQERVPTHPLVLLVGNLAPGLGFQVQKCIGASTTISSGTKQCEAILRSPPSYLASPPAQGQNTHSLEEGCSCLQAQRAQC
jgi:hypothetical protein